MSEWYCINACKHTFCSNIVHHSSTKKHRPATITEHAGKYALVHASNVTHISPFAVTQGIVAGAGAALGVGGHLVLYGPFTINGEFTTPSNQEFDLALKGRDSAWGYRDVAAVEAESLQASLKLVQRYEMPANNFLLHFVKQEF